jgi:RNA polymerase sigma-70 factor (ECF subfamily)
MEEERADEDLMLAYRGGDAAAFAALFRRRKGCLYRYLLRQCGQPGLAGELFEDIWLRVIRARLRYRPQALFITYLYRLAHQVLMDHYRRRPAGMPPSYLQEPEISIEPLLAQAQPDVMAASRQQLERLLQLLGTLPEAQREVFLLREEAGLGLEEIARVTAAKPESARNRLRQAVQFLRKGMRVGE